MTQLCCFTFLHLYQIKLNYLWQRCLLLWISFEDLDSWDDGDNDLDCASLLLLLDIRSLRKKVFECLVPVSNCCLTSSNEITNWAVLRIKFMLVMVFISQIFFINLLYIWNICVDRTVATHRLKENFYHPRLRSIFINVQLQRAGALVWETELLVFNDAAFITCEYPTLWNSSSRGMFFTTKSLKLIQIWIAASHLDRTVDPCKRVCCKILTKDRFCNFLLQRKQLYNPLCCFVCLSLIQNGKNL